MQFAILMDELNSDVCFKFCKSLLPRWRLRMIPLSIRYRAELQRIIQTIWYSKTVCCCFQHLDHLQFPNSMQILKLKFAIFLGHSINTNIYASIFPNIRQFMNEKEEGYIEELTSTSQCLNTKTAPLYIPLRE